MMTFKAPANAALIIVDMQNGFCPGGGLPVMGGADIVPAINQLQDSFDGTAVFATQDWHPANHKSFASNHAGAKPYDTATMPYGPQILWPDHCIQNTADADFHSDLKLADGARVIRKGTNTDVDSYSAFLEVDKKSHPRFNNGETLADTLKNEGKKTLVLCGLAYDFCVGFSALDARTEGFEVVVVKGATRSVGIETAPGQTTETLMDQQLRDAGVIVVDSVNDLPQVFASLGQQQNKTAAITSVPQPR